MSRDLSHARGRPKPHPRLAALLLVLTLCRCQCNEPLQSVPGLGSVDGYVCDPATNALAPNATVAGVGRFGQESTATDNAGYFLLDGLTSGPQTLAVTGSAFTSSLEVTVVADVTTRAPDPPCLVLGTGIVTGRICATALGIGSGEGYWLSGARVYVAVGTDVYETTSDENGSFTLSNVPAGNQTLHVEKGAFKSQTAIVVTAGEVTHEDELCVAPSTTIAVVTGMFDAIENVLFSMHFVPRACLPADMARCPTNLSADGTVTLVDGLSTYYITDFLANDALLAQYKIIFFNCGLDDQYFYNAPPEVKTNLAGYVQSGGSIYVSDYAYELIRDSFPGIMKFAGTGTQNASTQLGDNEEGHVGLAIISPPLPATITDMSLANVVGAPTLDIVYNKAGWVPLAALTAQPLGAHIWMKAAEVPLDMNRDGTADSSVSGDPLLMSVKYGQGRVSYTTFHMHEQATAQMRVVLQYMVFEL